MTTDFDFRVIATSFLAILISLTVQEFAHAFAADALGDKTASEMGRLTLNPLVIIRAHPFGALLMPLLGAFSGFLFGWASTPVNLARIDRKHGLRKASLIISAAGPISNLLLAFVSAFVFVALEQFFPQASLAQALSGLAKMLVVSNAFLCFFNFLPVPPLDGYSVLAAILPPSCRSFFVFIERHQLFVLLLVFYLGGRLVSAPVAMVVSAFIKLAMLVFS